MGTENTIPSTLPVILTNRNTNHASFVSLEHANELQQMASFAEALAMMLSWHPSLVLLLVGIQFSLGGHHVSFSSRIRSDLIRQYAHRFLDWAGMGIYNVFFHPLARFPGPKLWTACRLPFLILVVKRRPRSSKQTLSRKGRRNIQ